MTCPNCGSRRGQTIQTKDGAKYPAPCKDCMARDRERAHQTIARLALECGRRGLPDPK